METRSFRLLRQLQPLHRDLLRAVLHSGQERRVCGRELCLVWAVLPCWSQLLRPDLHPGQNQEEAKYRRRTADGYMHRGLVQSLCSLPGRHGDEGDGAIDGQRINQQHARHVVACYFAIS